MSGSGRPCYTQQWIEEKRVLKALIEVLGAFHGFPTRDKGRRQRLVAFTLVIATLALCAWWHALL
jgi:hypothetical protein